MGEFRRAADDLKDNLDINGMKAEKEKLMRDITQNQLNLDKKPEAENPPPQAEETEKEKKE
jgi:hypothetical protein